jgi:hypothetical protein
MDLNQAGEHRKMQILELEEFREKAYHSATIYKERTKRWHDSRLKPKIFNPGDKVFLLYPRVKMFGQGKVWTKWLGQYLIIDTSTRGAIMIQEDEGNIYKVNDHRLKLLLDYDRATNEDIDVIELVNHEYMLD